MLAPKQSAASVQNMNPYTNATELPDGITSPILPARQIHVLSQRCQHLTLELQRSDKGILGITYFKIAKLMPTIVSLLSRSTKCPPPLASGSPRVAWFETADAIDSSMVLYQNKAQMYSKVVYTNSSKNQRKSSRTTKAVANPLTAQLKGFDSILTHCTVMTPYGPYLGQRAEPQNVIDLCIQDRFSFSNIDRLWRLERVSVPRQACPRL